jgi:4,5:9,10-diseco-3-hydroxy-5,9,17-trioxoandrosta-1(10),2-diene-4-oate hydrolase
MPLPDLSKYEKYQKVTNGYIRYYEMGSGDEHTILAHGMGVVTSADTFQFAMEHLAKDLHIYAIDYLGFGKSSRTLPQGPTFDVIVDGIREFMDAKGIESANLIGHSAGGWFGPILAYESPHRIRKLISMGGAGMNVEPAGGEGTPENDFLGRYAPASLEGARASINRSLYEGSQMTEELADAMAQQMFEHGTREGALEGLKPLVRQMATAEVRAQYLIQRRLPHIKVPCLFIWGKGGPGQSGDTMDPYPTWTEEYDRLSGDMSKSVKPWVVPGASYLATSTGHNIQWEKPELFAQICIDYIKKGTVFTGSNTYGG